MSFRDRLEYWTLLGGYIEPKICMLQFWGEYYKIMSDNTGLSVGTVKNFLLIARARKQPISWDRCLFVHQTRTFWYLVSQKINNHSVIIHLWRLLRCISVKILKIHWKLMILKSQYCFANISITKARIFMKFKLKLLC